MNITILIDLLPDSVKADVIDFNDVLLKNRKNAIRVMMDRILTEEEKQEMKKNKHFMGVDCVAQYRHAPEIKKKLFLCCLKNRRKDMVRKLVVNGETVVLSDEVLNKLRHQEYIEKGKLIVKTLGLNDVYNKMTDDDFAMIADDFIYALNTTSDNISEMMEAAVQKITQKVEERCNQVEEKNAKDIQKNMESRKLIVNGQSIILSSEVINELHRQERIEEGKYMMEFFSSTDTFGKMTDDNFEEIVLYFEEMLNADTNELMAEAVQNVSEQVEKRYRYKTKIDVQKKLLKQRRTDNY